MMVIDNMSIQVNITLEWMLEYLIGWKSTLAQVMAWCPIDNKPLPEPVSVDPDLHQHPMAPLGHK